MDLGQKESQSYAWSRPSSLATPITSSYVRVSTTTSGRWPTGGSSSTSWAQQTGQRSRSTTSSAALPAAEFIGPTTCRRKLATWTLPFDGGFRPSITGSGIRLSQSVPVRGFSLPANGHERRPRGVAVSFMPSLTGHCVRGENGAGSLRSQEAGRLEPPEASHAVCWPLSSVFICPIRSASTVSWVFASIATLSGASSSGDMAP